MLIFRTGHRTVRYVSDPCTSLQNTWQRKKNYYCKEHKFSLMFTGLFILFNKATTTTSPLITPPPLSSPLFRRPRAARRASPGTLRVARNFTHRYHIISLPVTLRTTNAESEKIATLEVKYGTLRTNFTHRIAWKFFSYSFRVHGEEDLIEIANFDCKNYQEKWYTSATTHKLNFYKRHYYNYYTNVKNCYRTNNKFSRFNAADLRA